MMEKPMPASLDVDANSRHFYDPAEKIQMWFGGRAWFAEMGNTKVHRCGLLSGIGWEFDGHIAKTNPIEATGVRIQARKRQHDGAQFYDMLFVQRRIDYDEAGFMEGQAERIVFHVPGLAGEELKAEYAKVLGEYAV